MPSDRKDSPFLIGLVQVVVRRLRRDPAYELDPQMSSRELAVELRRRLLSALWAVWALRGVRGGWPRFAERGCRINHRHALRIGRGTVVEAYAQLHCRSAEGFVIGERVTIGKFAILESSGVLWNRGVGLVIGDNSSVGDWGFVGASGGVRIGDRVLMGQRVAIHSQNHHFDDPEIPIQQQGVRQEGVVIGNDCWLGSGAVILDGVTLGDGCVVTAGSVVTKSFPARSVIGGVPARLLRERGRPAAAQS